MAEKTMVIRYISRQIVANKNYCSHNCPGMSVSANYCSYFQSQLTKEKKGPLRLKMCKDRELSLKDEE